MKKILYGFNPHRLRRLAGAPLGASPFTAAQLARIGIPAHKIPRVQEELARLAPTLPDRAVQLQLARRIAEQLL